MECRTTWRFTYWLELHIKASNKVVSFRENHFANHVNYHTKRLLSRDAQRHRILLPQSPDVDKMCIKKVISQDWRNQSNNMQLRNIKRSTKSCSNLPNYKQKIVSRIRAGYTRFSHFGAVPLVELSTPIGAHNKVPEQITGFLPWYPSPWHWHYNSLRLLSQEEKGLRLQVSLTPGAGRLPVFFQFVFSRCTSPKMVRSWFPHPLRT